MVMSYINQKMQLSQPPVSGMTADIHELQKELQRMRNLLQAKETGKFGSKAKQTSVS